MAQHVIYKYAINEVVTRIELPVGATVLHVHTQGDGIFLWASIDPHETKKEKRSFEMVGTGVKFNPLGKVYIGTAHIGSFVFHIFELDPPATKLAPSTIR